MPSLLHPFIVHLPIAFALFYVPFAWLCIRDRIQWSWFTLYSLCLCASLYGAMASGSVDRAIVEKNRPSISSPLEEHEGSAQKAFFFALAALALSFAGKTRFSQAAKIACGLIALAVLANTIQTARLGGNLVYKHGAAEAHAR